MAKNTSLKSVKNRFLANLVGSGCETSKKTQDGESKVPIKILIGTLLSPSCVFLLVSHPLPTRLAKNRFFTLLRDVFFAIK